MAAYLVIKVPVELTRGTALSEINGRITTSRSNMYWIGYHYGKRAITLITLLLIVKYGVITNNVSKSIKF
jgi:hypothetical protein